MMALLWMGGHHFEVVWAAIITRSISLSLELGSVDIADINEVSNLERRVVRYILVTHGHLQRHTLLLKLTSLVRVLLILHPW